MKEVEELDALNLCGRRTKMIVEEMEKVCQGLFEKELESYFEGKANMDRIKLLGERRLLGIGIPRDYGGIGGNNLDTALAFVSLGSNLGMSAVSFMNVQNGLVAKTILRWGTEEQKKRFLPDLASGKKIGSFCLTEPEAGSDPSSLRTTFDSPATHFANNFISGTKYLITNGNMADVFIDFAYPKGPKRKKEDLSVFIVERSGNESQILTESLHHKIGLHASDTALIEFNDAFVPKENILRLGRGNYVYDHSFLSGRLGIAAGCVGVILDCLNSAMERSKYRVQHGKPIAKHQLVQAHISAIAEDFEKARLPTYNAAIIKDIYDLHQESSELRKKTDYKISIAKRIAANAAFDAADRAVQVGGGFGYSTLYSPARHFKDVRVARIYEGSDEMMTLKAAYYLLGEGFEAFK
ncbi:MAG: acyl-CoA dehydrogenase family protein [Candidatus Nealsonbacteria bacterium]|nr:acyl-CoA dehydrogenase family protein [Candidatus Nealsonbacteria bacterium]